MNNLSWLLYLAELCNNVGIFFTIIGTLIFLSSAFVSICAYAAGEDHRKRYGEDDSDYKKCRAYFGLFRWFVPIGFVLWTIGLALPSKETVYLIIASEAGEEVLQSPTGKKAIDAVNRYLDSVGANQETPEERRNKSATE